MDHKSDITGDKDTFMSQEELIAAQAARIANLETALAMYKRVCGRFSFQNGLKLKRMLRKVKQNDARTSELELD